MLARGGATRFTDVMLTVGVNPGILNKVLIHGVACGVLVKNGRGYYLTEKGVKALGAAKLLRSLNG